METKDRPVTVGWAARACVRLFAPPDEAAGILADLADESADLARTRGRAEARRFVRWQVVHSLRPWLARRGAEAGRAFRETLTMLQRGWWSDTRLAVRRLVKARAFSTLAVATLAIGIGAVSTVFSLAYAVWLKPVPYANADRLAYVGVRSETTGSTASLSRGEFSDLRRAAGAFSGVAGYYYGAAIALVNGEPVRIVAYPVTTNLFRVLGVRPVAGRDFDDADAATGANVVMLSHDAWVKRFGGDAAAIGGTMTLGGETYRIVGVMPSGFAFPRGLEANIWIPGELGTGLEPQDRLIQTVARLAPGQTFESGAAAVDAIVRNQPAAATAGARYRATITPADVTATRDSRTAFQVLLGIVGLFLLIACANLAGLLLARNAARRRELALCLSLGASRLRLARAQLIETGVLAAAGCSAGVLCAWYGARLMAAMMPPNTSGLDAAGVNGAVVAVAVAASFACAMLIGLLPALSLRSMKAAESMAATRTVAGGATRSQRALVVVEVALALMLVVGANVMLRAFADLIGRDRGYDPRGLVTMNVSLPFADDSYQATDRRARAFADILDRVRAVPGVRAAAATTGFPGSPLGILGLVAVAPPGGAKPGNAALHAASPDYFATMGTPLKAGRAFAATDLAASPGVVIVNERLAREYPEANPIGQHLMVRAPGQPERPFEIIGVAGDQKLGERATPRVFVPLAQASAYWVDLVVRTDGSDAVLARVREALRAHDRNLLLENDSSFAQIISDSVALQRAQSAFAMLASVLSVVVAGVGLYALMTFVAAQRRREMSVRLAIGAPPQRLFGHVMAGALRLIGAGIVLGVVATMLIVRALGGVVFGLTSATIGAYVGASVVVLIVALIAAAIPARRVLRVDPLLALRAE